MGHYGVSKALSSPLDPSNGFALQFEARQEEGLECGGAYLKYLNADEYDADSFDGDTPYTVMFGPDKCGGTNKVHVIFKHKSPLDGEVEEKHLKNPPRMPVDEKVHLYSLEVNEDNTYTVSIDGKEEKTGSLFEDFEPPFNPPKEIDDPEDKKPEDWVEMPRWRIRRRRSRTTGMRTRRRPFRTRTPSSRTTGLMTNRWKSRTTKPSFRKIGTSK